MKFILPILTVLYICLSSSLSYAGGLYFTISIHNAVILANGETEYTKGANSNIYFVDSVTYNKNKRYIADIIEKNLYKKHTYVKNHTISFNLEGVQNGIYYVITEKNGIIRVAMKIIKTDNKVMYTNGYVIDYYYTLALVTDVIDSRE